MNGVKGSKVGGNEKFARKGKDSPLSFGYHGRR